MTADQEALAGGCTCGQLRYEMQAEPLVVHGCHCTWCQTQTGTAFAINAVIEADRTKILTGVVENIMVETPAGFGQRIARCPSCKVAVWSEYLVMTSGVTDLIYFIRVGTLDNPSRLPPDVHIYTSTKVSWLTLPPDALAVEEYYVTEDVWSPGSLERRARLRDIIKTRTA